MSNVPFQSGILNTVRFDHSNQHGSQSRIDNTDFSRIFREALEQDSSYSKDHSPGRAIQEMDHLYRVKEGDCLSKIIYNFLESHNIGTEERLSTLVGSIAAHNGITDPDFILVGQKVNLSPLALSGKQDNDRDSENRAFSHNEIHPGEKTKGKGDETAHGLLDIIQRIASNTGVNPDLSIAIAAAESGTSSLHDRNITLDPNAVNQDSQCKGLFQLLDKTGERFHRMLGLNEDYNPFNISQNVTIGVNYLKYLDKTFSKETILHRRLHTIPISDPSERKYFYIAAFNSGEGRVARAQQMAMKDGNDPRFYKNIEAYLPSETKEYVQKVLRFEETLG